MLIIRLMLSPPPPFALPSTPQNVTQLPITAHNRWWSTEVTYARQNGGDYDFIVETSPSRATNRTRPSRARTALHDPGQVGGRHGGDAPGVQSWEATGFER
jgi:hypothetical protein